MPIHEIKDYLFIKYLRKSEELSKLYNLWRLLNERIFTRQDDRSFAAGHGKPHIINVLNNINDLIKHFELKELRNIFSKKELCEIFAAAMIHDSGMVELSKEVEDLKKARLAHSSFNVIEKVTSGTFEHTSFKGDEIENIIRIAAAHDKDHEKDADKKLNEIISKEGKQSHIYVGAIMLRFADFFDVGRGRLRKDAGEVPWDDDQRSYFNKNRALKVKLVADDKLVLLSLAEVPKEFELSKKSRFEILYRVWGEGEDIVKLINESVLHKKGKWNIEIKENFGKIYPLGQVKWANLFKSEFIPALTEWKNNPDNRERPMEVDMMGHSLYARFAEDREDLNKLLHEKLKTGDIALRIMILDPFIENQQMCEVLMAQRQSQKPEEKGRSILPKFDKDWIIVKGQEGDIRKSLNKIQEWGIFVKSGSSIEVRGTSSPMNMGVVRYGNLMIVTPYSNMGLFNNSCAMVSTSESPLFEDTKSEFDTLWDDRETRLLYSKWSSIPPTYNPISRLFRPQMCPDPVIPSFEYEKFILRNYKERLLHLFSSKCLEGMSYHIPPYEIEIQPSSSCDFKCVFCIGSHLNRRSNHQNLQNTSEDSIDSLFYSYTYESKVYKVERFRISGLTGDPLAEPAQEFTLKLIDKIKENNREVIVITNGLYLGKPSVFEKMLNVDCTHVSLDAATKDTFSKIKRVDGDIFPTIIFNITKLCEASKTKREANENSEVGIGFIVTQENAHEVIKAIVMAETIGVRFIRFKPDIRRVGGISWEAWITAENMIRSKQLEIIKKKKTGEECVTDIIVTEVPLFQHMTPRLERCWLQYFVTTVGPDGNVYPCDHLTANGQKITLGDLQAKPFPQIWQKPLHRDSLGGNCPECQICPPFGWRLNRLLDELYILYKGYGTDGLNVYIDNALKLI